MTQDGGTGNRKSRAKGSSVEFSDYREYIMGDDFKKLTGMLMEDLKAVYKTLYGRKRVICANIFRCK